MEWALELAAVVSGDASVGIGELGVGDAAGVAKAGSADARVQACVGIEDEIKRGVVAMRGSCLLHSRRGDAPAVDLAAAVAGSGH